MLRNLFLFFFNFIFNFIMAKQLNASCSFQNGLLVCKLTGDAVEVVLKVKMKWGKHTLIKDQYNRTKKFHPWERADRVKISTRRNRMPDVHRTQIQMMVTL